MFNLSGSEIVFLLLIALIVLGPEKLPEAVRKFGKVYAEAKKMTTGFQSELKSALDEPMREMRETAEAFKSAAGLGFNVDEVDAPVDEAAAPTDAVDEPATVEATDVPEVTNEPPPTVAEVQPKVVEAVEETGTE
ncbi:MAG TPA: Sec-independent protein translocase protein TatB [Ilumatobacteraceae bacterium]|nr:Sec-independent protein translocase protein TatB [Ilumatobacteraceae bacterium]